MAKNLAVNHFSCCSKRVLINTAKACIKALSPVNPPKTHVCPGLVSGSLRYIFRFKTHLTFLSLRSGNFLLFFSDDTVCFSGADPLAMYRWSILRSFFSAVHAFKMAGRHHRASKRQRVVTIQTSLCLGSHARRHQWPLQIINWNLKPRDIINILWTSFPSVCLVSYGLPSRLVRGDYKPGFRTPNFWTCQTSLHQAHGY